MNAQCVKLLCGEKTVGLELPGPTTLLEMKKMEALPDPSDAILEALSHPLKVPL